MEKRARKNERTEALLKILSIYVSAISFWVITFSWNYLFGSLELVPRLGLGAALSWVVFLHMEAIGMIIMTMMKERWLADARMEAMEARLREAQAQAREAQAQETIRDLRRQLREARGEGANGVEDA